MSHPGKTIVVSQPMFFPWIGLFEQIALADVFIHYDDVQLPQGRSFISRVQLKNTDHQQTWLTAPIDRKHSGNLINESLIQEDPSWKDKHLKTIQHLYSKAPFFLEMYEVVEQLYNHSETNLADFNIYAIEKISDWFGLRPTFKRSSDLDIKGHASERLCDICLQEEATNYVTGLGALKYLNYDLFEQHNIRVEYIDYQKKPYAQLYGDFIPYVSIIDVMANMGREGKKLMISKSIYWKGFVHND